MTPHIHYFGREVDVTPLKRGFGVYSLIIRVLDWLRVSLERAIVLAVLRCELRKLGTSKKEAARILQKAKTDPEFDPAAFHEMASTTRRMSFRDMLNEKLGTPRGLRYQEGRKNTSEQSPHERPISFDVGARVTFAEYQKRHDRACRYASKDYKFDPDGDDFERVGSDV